MAGFRDAIEAGKKVAIKDEGVTLTSEVGSIDFVGAGVTGSAVGDAVTETIPGTDVSLYAKLDGTNQPFTNNIQVNNKLMIGNTGTYLYLDGDTLKLYVNNVLKEQWTQAVVVPTGEPIGLLLSLTYT